MPFLCIRLSQKVLCSFMRLYELLEERSESITCRVHRPSKFDKPNVLGESLISFSLKLDHFNIHVDLEDEVESDSAVLCTFNKIAIR